MPIIALTGRKGSGKDTVADVLAEHFGYATRFKFADPFKNMFRTLLAMDGYDPAEIEEFIEGHRKEDGIATLGGASPRRAMQTLGTEWRRELNPPASSSMWAEMLYRRIGRSLASRIVITDWRFPEEVPIVWRLNAVTVRVERPGLALNQLSEHDSEAHIDDLPVRYIIKNTGTLEEFKAHVLDTFRHGSIPS